MNTQELINKKEEELKVLNAKLEAEKMLKDRKIIKFKGKEFIIIKWNKPIKDLKVKGYRIAEFQEFVDLIDSKNIELEKYKYYLVKHFSKIQQTKKYCLSGLYMGVGGLDSGNDIIEGSDSGGRVVLIKEKSK